MKTGKIVFIEDNIHDAELIRLSFRETKFGGELIHFDSGISFLHYLENENPKDILFVVLDMEMPHMTGLQTLEIMNKKNLKQFPVIFFTSCLDGQNLQKAKDLKADAFISKARDFDDFQRTISDIWRFYGELNEFSRPKALAMI